MATVSGQFEADSECGERVLRVGAISSDDQVGAETVHREWGGQAGIEVRQRFLGDQEKGEGVREAHSDAGWRVARIGRAKRRLNLLAEPVEEFA